MTTFFKQIGCLTFLKQIGCLLNVFQKHLYIFVLWTHVQTSSG